MALIRIAPWPPRRRADISPDLRKLFEKYGEDLMRVAIESGDGSRIGQELAYLGQKHREEIVLWRQEKREDAARYQRRMLWIAWATGIIAVVTLGFVVWGFALDHFVRSSTLPSPDAATRPLTKP
jgi:hypothetical protein